MKVNPDSRILIGLGLVLPILLLLPFIGGFFFNAGSSYTDMAISHYPNALYLQRSIQAGGQIPLWSDTILSGTPFSANPLSGLHYPLGWIGLLFPLPFGLNLTAVLHLILAGMGMYLFFRGEGMHPIVALFGAIGYESLPKLFAHLGAGHLTMIYAASWAPWLLLAQQAANWDLKRFWMMPGLVLGIIFLADPRYAAIAGILWAAYLVQSRLMSDSNFTKRGWLHIGLFSVGTILLGLFLGAVLLLPMLEYVGLSTRSLLTPEDLQSLSLPPLQLLGLLVPNIAGSAEWVLYPGAAMISLAVVAGVSPVRRKKVLFWAFFFLFTLIWSMGNTIPGLSLLSRLPGFNLLRVPPRMMLAGFTALIILACLSLQNILDTPVYLRNLPKTNPLLVLFGIDLFLVLFTVVVALVSRPFPWRFLWGAAAYTVALLLIFLIKADRISVSTFGYLIIAFLLVDTMGVNLMGLDFHTKDDVLSEGAPTAEALVTQKAFDYFRVYSPSYSLPQQTAAYWRLELADGIDPLQLMSYSQFMRDATGVLSTQYSVTMPPFETGDPAVDNMDSFPNPFLLGLLNVRYVASAFPLKVEGLNLIEKYGATYLYNNDFEAPRAWVQDAQLPVGEGASEVNTILISANRIELYASGPGLLVVSEIFYPGWSAIVDGNETHIQPVAGLLRGVKLQPGNHLVKMVYQPRRLFTGLGISLTALLGCVIAYLIGRRWAYGK